MLPVAVFSPNCALKIILYIYMYICTYIHIYVHPIYTIHIYELLS